MKQAAGLLVYCLSTKRFLIAKRGPTINDPNLWATFGGKMDKGETIIQTAEREFKEESGYNNAVNILPTPMPVTNEDGFVFTTFLATVENEFIPPMVGQVTVDGEVETTKVRWVDIETLKKMIDSKITHPGFNNFLKKYTNIKENNMRLSENETGDQYAYGYLKRKGSGEKIKGEVRWNPHWKRFQVIVDGTIYEEFKDFDEAVNNLKNGGFKNVKITTESKQKVIENYIRKIVISEMKKHL